MKILTVRSVLTDMGPGTQPLTIAREMRRRGHETVFASASGAYIPTIREAGFRVEIVPGLAPERHNPIAIPKAILHLRKLIAETQPDVIHGHNGAATLCAYAASRSLGLAIPCATSVRGVEERDTHQWRNMIWKRIPGVLLGVCEKTRERLLSFGVPDDKIQVTYNGIDAGLFDPAKANERDALREEFGLVGKTVIGTIGAIKGPETLSGPTKGQHHLVEAVAALKDRHPDLAILLVGDGPARNRVEKRVAELGVEDRVVFAGRRFDAARMLSVMDIYCLASIFGEFFPNSIIEAMCMELPWVGSDIAGLGELTANGEAGWISKPGDVDALAANIDRLARDGQLRKLRGQRGREEVLARFTIQKVADRILSAYRDAGLKA